MYSYFIQLKFIKYLSRVTIEIFINALRLQCGCHSYLASYSKIVIFTSSKQNL